MHFSSKLLQKFIKIHIFFRVSFRFLIKSRLKVYFRIFNSLSIFDQNHLMNFKIFQIFLTLHTLYLKLCQILFKVLKLFQKYQIFCRALKTFKEKNHYFQVVEVNVGSGAIVFFLYLISLAKKMYNLATIKRNYELRTRMWFSKLKIWHD